MNLVCSFGMCLLNDEMLLIAGGIVGSYMDERVTNDCILFNTNYKQFMFFKYDQFKHLPSMNFKREGQVLVDMSGIIYSIGGWNGEDEFLSSIEEFHPSTEEWKISAFELKKARSFHQAVAHKHFIYVFGGRCKNLPLRTRMIEKINTVTKRVEIIATKLRVAISHFEVAKVDEKALLFGGVTGVWYPTDSVEIFDLNTEQIEQGVKMPFSDYDLAACVL